MSATRISVKMCIDHHHQSGNSTEKRNYTTSSYWCNINETAVSTFQLSLCSRL